MAHFEVVHRPVDKKVEDLRNVNEGQAKFPETMADDQCEYKNANLYPQLRLFCLACKQGGNYCSTH